MPNRNSNDPSQPNSQYQPHSQPPSSNSTGPIQRTVWNLYTSGQMILTWSLILVFETQRSFLAQIITGDSLFLALNFLTGQDFLTIPELTVIDKYSYYLFISCGCQILDYLSWSYLTMVWQTFAILSTCPSIQRTLFEIHEVQETLEWFHQKQKQGLQTVLCYSLSRIINSMTKINLQTDPKISYTELLHEIQLNTENTEPLWRFVKIFLVNTLIKVLGHRDSYKMRVLKYFYQHGHVIEIPLNQGSILPSDRKLTPKEILRLVVFHRRWHYLYDPQVLNGLIELYQSNQTPYFREACLEVLADLRYRSLKFGTIWTICSVLNKPDIFPVISILMEITWKRQAEGSELNRMNFQSYFKNNWGLVVFKTLGFLTYWTGVTGYLTGALITEFAPMLDNQASNFLLAGIRERWVKWKLYFCHQNQFNSELIRFSGLIVVIKYLCEYLAYVNTFFKNLSLLGLTLVIRFRDPTRFWIFKSLILWGWFSDYHPIHLCGLSLGLYLIINLKNYREVPLIKPNINLYHSYYHAETN